MEQRPDFGKIYELEGRQKVISESNNKNIGWVLCLVFISIGTVLSFTGIGAVIGIPLIFAGIISPFVSKKTDTTMFRVLCPTCGHEVLTLKKPGITCKACKKRMVLQGDRYVKVD